MRDELLMDISRTLGGLPMTKNPKMNLGLTLDANGQAALLQLLLDFLHIELLETSKAGEAHEVHLRAKQAKRKEGVSVRGGSEGEEEGGGMCVEVEGAPQFQNR